MSLTKAPLTKASLKNRGTNLLKSLWTLVVLGTFVLITPAWADTQSSERLQQYIDQLETFQADFEQTLYDSDSQALSTSTGSVKLKRPGRFVWIYAAPEPQQIVADGERIWLYDEDLQQVTVNVIDERINGSPLQLLMEAGDLSDSFELTSLGEADGIDWVELKPRDTGSDFELVFIGLDSDGLAAMELRDNFGQATQIRFSNYQSGLVLDDELFRFDPPAGVDIIGLDE